jgi:hypothetical protein
MAKVFAADINLSQNQVINVVIHSGGTEPTTPVEGQFFYNTASHMLKFYNGTGWVSLGNIGNMDAAVADVEMGDKNITGLADPVNAKDATNKQYVDSVCEGLDVKPACRLASTGNIVTLSSLLTVDGVVTVAGDRVLIKDQTTASQNGIYVVAAGAWTRSTDCATWQDLFSAYTTITAGTTLAATNYVCTIKPGGTLGVTNVTWSLFSSAALTTITSVGTGLAIIKSKVGNDFPIKSLTATSTAVVLANNTNDIGVDASANLKGLHSNTTVGLVAQTVSGTTYIGRTLTAPAAGITITNGNGVSGNPTLVLANDLAGVEGLSTTGLAARTADGAWSTRTLTAPAAGMTVTNGNGVAGNPTLVLANDLNALEGLASTGIAVRTASDTWAQRQVTSTGSTMTITNPAGIADDINLEVNVTDLHTNKKLAKYYQGTFSWVASGNTITVTHNLGLVTPFIPLIRVFETASLAVIEVETIAGSTTNALNFKMTGSGFNITAGYYSIIIEG